MTKDMQFYLALKASKWQQTQRMTRVADVARVAKPVQTTAPRHPIKVVPKRKVKSCLPHCPNKGNCCHGFCCVKSKVSKKEVKMFLRAVGIIVSSFGFLYQTTQLLTIYLSGKTSVDNRVERMKQSELPAITICLPTFISMDRFANHVLRDSSRREYLDLYKEYKEFRNTFIEWNASTIKKHKELHRRFVFEVFPNANITIRDIFDKISIQELTITKFDSLAMKENDSLVELSRPIPFQSIAPFSDPRKCFTYFNEFDKNYRHEKFKLINLFMRFRHDNFTFPVDEYYTGDFHISIHSANILPNYAREEAFKNLRMRQINAISFSETRTTLLPMPYDTDCKVYEVDDSGRTDMRSDCQRKCVDRQLLTEFSHLKCISTNANFKLIRRDNLHDMAQLRLCNYGKFDKLINKKMVYSQLMREHECDEQCLKNCRESFYDFTLDVIKGHSDITEKNEFEITLQHNRFPDQIIEHKPIMSWIELMSNFGGLLGMWLGLSIAFVFEYFIRLIK